MELMGFVSTRYNDGTNWRLVWVDYPNPNGPSPQHYMLSPTRPPRIVVRRGDRDDSFIAWYDPEDL